MVKIKNGFIFLIIILLLIPVFYANAEPGDAEESASNIVSVAENDTLALSVDLANCYVYIKNKSDNKIWCTNPEDPEENDYTTPITVNNMKSQLLVTYFDETKKRTTVCTYTRCVMQNSFEIRKIKNGVLVTYNFADEDEQFKIQLQYVLNNDYLEVTVPADKIVESGESKISEISVLPFFMSGNVSEEGYALIPDGSGALIDFSQINENADPYCEKVYGRDTAVAYLYDTGDKKPIRMPVYGVSKADGGIFARISSNEACAYICANQTGYISDNTNVYTSFVYRQLDTATIAGKDWNYNEYTVAAEHPVKTDMAAQYRFLSSPNCGYSDMAKMYRDVLVSENGLEKLTPQSKTDAVINVFGTVKKKTSFLGIPYNKNISASTFDDAREMIAFFNDGGISNVSAMLYGFDSGGYKGTAGVNTNYTGAAGGNKGYEKLLSCQASTDNVIYTVKDFMHDYDPSFLFFKKGNYARAIDNTTLMNTNYLRSTYSQSELSGRWFSFTANKISANWRKYISNLKSRENAGVSMEFLASELYSDYNGSKYAERQNMLKNFTEIMEAADGYTTAFDGGNIYCMKYADMIYDAPVSSSEFDCAAFSVPFYSMVLHGYVNIASTILNVRPDNGIAFLECVESGILPAYAMTGCDNYVLRDTRLEFLYNSNFSSTKDEVLGNLKKYGRIADEIYNQEITAHERANELAVTTYANGYKTVVNYGDSDKEYTGHMIVSKDYILINSEGDLFE